MKHKSNNKGILRVGFKVAKRLCFFLHLGYDSTKGLDGQNAIFNLVSILRFSTTSWRCCLCLLRKTQFPTFSFIFWIYFKAVKCVHIT